MSLYSTIAISVLFFATGFGVLILFFYFTYRFSRKNVVDGIQHKIPRKSRRKGKYLLNNFTARIFFSDFTIGKRIKVLNGNTPLTTEKYSFTKTKIFDN